MDSPLLALALPPLLLVPAMGMLSRIDCRNPLETEVRRKALHVSVGLVSLSFPMLLRESWMVVTVVLVIAAWMLVVRHVPSVCRRFGGVLHDAKRKSYGELYFVLSIAGLLLLSSGETLLYVIPILILSIADALAAVAGRAFPIHPLRGLAAGKTASGSAAFFLSAFVIVLSLLAGFTQLSVPSVLGIAIVIAATTCFVEAIGSRGLDNLLVPATAFLLLKFLVTGF